MTRKLLMLAIAKSHDLHESPGRFRTPVGADLFVGFKVIAPEAREHLPEARHEPHVFRALVLGHDVAVRLQ